MEEPIKPDEGSTHPDGSDPSQPPSIGLHNEVGIVKHAGLIL